jgi:flavin reductase (DIM6/NTAB) family NADH-FMN oxidoreductase RutF
MTPGVDARIDQKWFRQVLGQYPTGVCVVTASDKDGPAGMAVGSFTSVSLDPPLVAFLADESSTTWPRIRRAGHFCVNVIAADQEHICRAFARRGGEKFGDLSWRAARSGAPILDGVIAWIDCDIDAVHEAGDHYIVIGAVRELDIVRPHLPLLFFQGGYGRFIPQSLATGDLDLIRHFHHMDVVRPELEQLANDARVEATAAIRIADEVVVIATAGRPRGRHLPTRVGFRYALTPPVGAVFAAWSDATTIDAWLKRAPNTDEEAHHRHREGLRWIRDHGYCVFFGSIPPASGRRSGTPRGSPRDLGHVVRDLRIALDPMDTDGIDTANFWATIHAPAFDSAGNVALLIGLNGFDTPFQADDFVGHVELLMHTAQRVTGSVRRRSPYVSSHHGSKDGAQSARG